MSSTSLKPGVILEYDFSLIPDELPQRKEIEKIFIANKAEKHTIEDDEEEDFEKDPNLIFFLEQAEDGNLQAMLSLVKFYEEKSQFMHRFRLLKRISEEDEENAEVWFKLGECYSEGKGVKYDLKLSAACFMKAAKRGHTRGKFRAAESLEGIDIVNALKYYNEAAEEGDADAMFKLAKHFKEIDSFVYLEWLEKSALGKNREACFEWGMHRISKGEITEAANFIKFASDMKHAEACYELAALYNIGKGVERNENKSIELLERALVLGSESAKKIIAKVFCRKELKKVFNRKIVKRELKSNPKLVGMPKPAISAYLFKKSQKISEKRFFVLNGPFFSYFKDANQSYAIFKVHLRGAKITRLPSMDKEKQFYFSITNSANFTVQIFADSKEKADEWVQNLEQSRIYYECFDKRTADIDELHASDLISKADDLAKWDPSYNHANTLSGYINKQGGKWRSWNKRWFVLCDNYLFYFKDEFSTHPEGSIPLKYATIEIEKDKGSNFCSIFTKFRNYFLEFNSSDEAIVWIKHIKKNIDNEFLQVPMDFSITARVYESKLDLN
jgi:TPR repeat protein